MTTTETAHSANATNDVTVDDDVLDAANEQAKQILASSRYEAFRLVTEARTEAETIIDGARSEAAGVVKAAEMTAKSKIESAEAHAADIVRAAEQRASDVTPETAFPVAGANATALEAEHRDLSERVSSLRVLADQLEHRFAALAASTPSGDGAVETTVRPPVTTLDYSPSVAPSSSKVETPVEIPPAEEDPERGSFYSRRSANLPRIGAAAGQSALELTRSIRERLEND
ncbi:hypothetical protein MNBD_ACTINO01-2148 [hydrothermal vent metagenome]|uniref:Uncharacterized protein n=1 Tax=hydrothermal vent metagenome TaxID=652676 RepID=A0A3B0SUN3_9ZZZZ